MGLRVLARGNVPPGTNDDQLKPRRLVGAAQGYFGGFIDLLKQRVVEIFAGLPILFVLIALASIVEPSVFLAARDGLPPDGCHR